MLKRRWVLSLGVLLKGGGRFRHVQMTSAEPFCPSLCTQPRSATGAAESPGKASGMVRVFHLQPALDKRGTTRSFLLSFPASALGGTSLRSTRQMDDSW